MKKSAKKFKEIKYYDDHDTSQMIDASQPLALEDLGLMLPADSPTKVISIRLPSKLLNDLKALSSEQDIPYQALIKLMLSQSVSKFKKGKAA